VTAFLVVASVAFVFLHLQPDLLFQNTTPAGGDMGAHVWAPAYLREQLLPHLRLSGWTPDWYAGFPVYVFYMVVPSLFIVVLDVFLFVPYNIAFKLVSVSGLVALPICAWAMGRMARLPFPVPAVLAVATVPFVFDRSFHIYGGNAASTLAGEFAFSISLAIALLFIGVVHRGLETGRSRALAAALLALTVTCHVIPAIFALVAAAVTLAFKVEWRPLSARSEQFLRNRSRVWWFTSALGVGGLLTCFWTLPFVVNRRYMTDMGWEKLHNYLQLLFPGRVGDGLARGWDSVNVALGGKEHQVIDGAVKMSDGVTPADMTWVIALAAVGVGTAIAFRRRFGLWLTATAGVFAVLVAVAPQGRLWNARLLPFWYLLLYFLAALAVVELVSAIAVLVTRDGTPSRRVLLAGPVAGALLTAVIVALPLWSLPGGRTSTDPATGASRYSWLFLSTKDHSYVQSWARWNYQGYEKKAAYPEYYDVVTTMGQVGKERGCGRAMWEYDKGLDRFGTPMALMLLPYWTDGCVGSMEGLYFEASATTPYHFLNQSELSAAPSRAQRDLPYGELDVDLGVTHLQLLGVKYYMAFSESAVAQAAANSNLTEVATTGNWHVYEVADADLVQPLTNEPAVVKGAADGGHTWQDTAVDWYVDPGEWDVLRADDGPRSWQRIEDDETPDARAVRKATVSRVEVSNDRIRFRVDRPGVPVLVKASYFPNWKASNAEGPYRVAPNLMVVIPTDEVVTLRYGRTGIDWLSMLLTLVGLALVVLLARRPRLPLAPPEAEQEERPAAPDPEPPLTTVGGPPAGRDRWVRPPE
jgi:hypothetical protein